MLILAKLKSLLSDKKGLIDSDIQKLFEFTVSLENLQTEKAVNKLPPQILELIEKCFDPYLSRFYHYRRLKNDLELKLILPLAYKSPLKVDINIKDINYGSVGKAYEKRGLIISNDKQLAINRNEWINIDDNIISKVVIPVIYLNEVIGIYILDFDYILRKSEESILEILGTIISYYINNAYENYYRERKLQFLQSIPNKVKNGIDTVLTEFFELFDEIFGVRLLNLWIYENFDSSEFLVLRSSYPEKINGILVSKADYDKRIMQLTKCTTGEVLKLKERRIYSKLREDEKFQNKSLIRKFDIDWCISFPILSDDMPIGVLNYTPLQTYNDLNTGSILNNKINNISEFLTMFEVVYKLADLLYVEKTLINYDSIISTLLSFSDDQSSWNELSMLVCELMTSEACSIFLKDEYDELVLKGSTGIVDNPDYNTVRYKLNEGLTGFAFQKGKPLLYIKDYLKPDGVIHSSKFREVLKTSGPSKSIIFLPLMDKDLAPIGIIRCNNKNQKYGIHYDQFTQQDIVKLEIIGKLISNIFLKITFISKSVEKQTRERERNILSLHHELLAPIDGIKSHIDWFNHQVNKNPPILDISKVKIKFEDINQNAELFHILIYSMGDLDKIKCSFDKLDLLATIRQCTFFLKDEFRRNDITLKMEYLYLPHNYIGDRLHLMRVFYNLLRNAIKYSNDLEQSKYIRIQATHNNNNVKIVLEDNGIGIISGEQDKIFNKFERGSNATAYFPEGTGLGLTFCRNIVNQHDGTINITNLKQPTQISIELSNQLKPQRDA